MNTITCSTHHATTQETAICSHAFSAWQAGGRVELVAQEPIESDPWPDAWCETCEVKFQAKRDELTDGFANGGDLVLLCTYCYGEVREAAKLTGGLRVV